MAVSTPVLWLLLFLVVFVVVLFSALSRTEFSTRKISMIGVMAALSFVAYEFFRIPTPSGSSFHLGNTFTALTALLLDGVSGGLAGAFGLALADIVAGDPGYALTTFVLKFIIGLVCGTVAHKVFHLHDLNGEGKGKVKYMTAVTLSAFSGLLVNVFTDPFGYFRTGTSSARRWSWLPSWPRWPAASRWSTRCCPRSARCFCTWRSTRRSKKPACCPARGRPGYMPIENTDRKNTSRR